ncbi:MAG: hypothetical protein H6765_03750 [Candidatus Peribacteria bacterium]|nr:MAG: hypothetical protein H6765_03750 [Candidatus Peribacteria bacterium]
MGIGYEANGSILDLPQQWEALTEMQQLFFEIGVAASMHKLALQMMNMRPGIV